MAKYVTYSNAAKEIKNVIENEMKIEGLVSVEVVYDRGGVVNNINVRFDARVKKDIWDIVKKYDFSDLPCYKRVVVEAYSNSFERKLEEYLDKKDKSILALRRGGKKVIIVQALYAETLLEE